MTISRRGGTKEGIFVLFHGNEPTYQLFHKKQQELDYLFDMVKNIVESQHKFSDIVVSTREKANLKEYRSLFHQREFPSFDINSSTGDKNGVHFCTLHSLKGLEFKHVFLVDINDRSFPYKPYDFSSWSMEDQEDHIKREKSLFSVAMTRAVQSVSISGVGDSSEILDF